MLSIFLCLLIGQIPLFWLGAQANQNPPIFSALNQQMEFIQIISLDEQDVNDKNLFGWNTSSYLRLQQNSTFELNPMNEFDAYQLDIFFQFRMLIVTNDLNFSLNISHFYINQGSIANITKLGYVQQSQLLVDQNKLGIEFLVNGDYQLYNEYPFKFKLQLKDPLVLDIGIVNVYGTAKQLGFECDQKCFGQYKIVFGKCWCTKCFSNSTLNEDGNCECNKGFQKLPLKLIGSFEYIYRSIMNLGFPYQSNCIDSTKYSKIKFFPSFEFQSAIVWLRNHIPSLDFQIKSFTFPNTQQTVNVYEITYRFHFQKYLEFLSPEFHHDLIICLGQQQIIKTTQAGKLQIGLNYSESDFFVQWDEDDLIDWAFCDDQQFMKKYPNSSYDLPSSDSSMYNIVEFRDLGQYTNYRQLYANDSRSLYSNKDPTKQYGDIYEKLILGPYLIEKNKANFNFNKNFMISLIVCLIVGPLIFLFADVHAFQNPPFFSALNQQEEFIQTIEVDNRPVSNLNLFGWNTTSYLKLQRNSKFELMPPYGFDTDQLEIEFSFRILIITNNTSLNLNISNLEIFEGSVTNISRLGVIKKSQLLADQGKTGNQFLVNGQCFIYSICPFQFNLQIDNLAVTDVGIVSLYATPQKNSYQCDQQCFGNYQIVNGLCRCTKCYSNSTLTKDGNCECNSGFQKLPLKNIGSRDYIYQSFMNLSQFIYTYCIDSTTYSKIKYFPSFEVQSAIVWLRNHVPSFDFQIKPVTFPNTLRTVNVYEITYRFHFQKHSEFISPNFHQDFIICLGNFRVYYDELKRWLFCDDQYFKQKYPNQTYDLPSTRSPMYDTVEFRDLGQYGNFSKTNLIAEDLRSQYSNTDPSKLFCDMFWTIPQKELKIMIQVDTPRMYDDNNVFHINFLIRKGRNSLFYCDEYCHNKNILSRIQLYKTDADLLFEKTNQIPTLFSAIKGYNQQSSTVFIQGVPGNEVMSKAMLCKDQLCQQRKENFFLSFQNMNYIQVVIANPYLKGIITIKSLKMENSKDQNIRYLSVQKNIVSPIRKQETIIGFFLPDYVQPEDFISVFIEATYIPTDEERVGLKLGAYEDSQYSISTMRVINDPVIIE